MSSFEVIIRHSVALERILSNNLGAKGPDLQAKLDSVRRRLPAALIAQVEYLISVRDETVNAAVVPDDVAEFEYVFAGVTQAFARIVGPIERSASTKTTAPAKAHVIAPLVELVAAPMATPEHSAWQVAKQDTAIEQMIGSLLARGEHEPDASALDEAPSPVEISEPHDEVEAQVLPKEVTMGALLVRPSVELDDATAPVEIHAPNDGVEASAPSKEITIGALLVRPTADLDDATPTEPAPVESLPVEMLLPVMEDRVKPAFDETPAQKSGGNRRSDILLPSRSDR